jgi:hypothetical protein
MPLELDDEDVDVELEVEVEVDVDELVLDAVEDDEDDEVLPSPPAPPVVASELPHATRARAESATPKHPIGRIMRTLFTNRMPREISGKTS